MTQRITSTFCHAPIQAVVVEGLSGQTHHHSVRIMLGDVVKLGQGTSVQEQQGAQVTLFQELAGCRQGREHLWRRPGTLMDREMPVKQGLHVKCC